MTLLPLFSAEPARLAGGRSVIAVAPRREGLVLAAARLRVVLVVVFLRRRRVVAVTLRLRAALLPVALRLRLRLVVGDGGQSFLLDLSVGLAEAGVPLVE